MSDCTSQMVCDVVEGLPCGICFVSMDDEERLVYGNRAFLSLTGFSSLEELLSWCGGSFEKLMAKGYIPLRQRYEAGKDGKVSAFHFLLETKAGPVPAEGLVGMEETAAFGKVWCVICICRQDDSKVDEAEQGVFLSCHLPPGPGGCGESLFRTAGAAVFQSYEFQNL